MAGDAAPTLYMHPLSSYCWKVLIALRENDTPFDIALVEGDPKQNGALMALWPVGKMPVLYDAVRNEGVAETSIIIEYLHRYYPGAAPLIPTDADAAREVRLWDRFFDLHISTPMQKIVGDRLRPESGGDPVGVQEAKRLLDIAYAMLEPRMAARRWAAGEGFSMADCAALPALFYADAVHPFRAAYPETGAYLDRLLGRPSVRETIRAAQPYFKYFPFKEALDPRFTSPDF